MRWDIFCTVVDNYGDIGVCWRLAKNLSALNSLQAGQQSVSLWVDDLGSFSYINPQVKPALSDQTIEGIRIRHWSKDFPIIKADEIPEIVIEAFACHLPTSYLQQLEESQKKIIWFNLEYLSAEAWIEDCHGLPSPQANSTLQKIFFFPGFTQKTGGLLRESALSERQQIWSANPQSWMPFFNIKDWDHKAINISLFSYENPALTFLLEVWKNSAVPIRLWVPQGRVLAQLRLLLDLSSTETMTKPIQLGSLQINALPFVEQDHYDALLWVCDINFVRGEDSLVRAIWAEKPFVWHIYPQENDDHHAKLQAFLQRYTRLEDQRSNSVEPMPHEALITQNQFWLAWNGVDQVENLSTWQDLWSAYSEYLPELTQYAKTWSQALAQQDDLARQLSQAAQSLHQKSDQMI